MHFVYVLQSKKDHKLYYGLTKDLRKRLDQHNKGLVSSTKTRLPIELIYFEEATNLSAARSKERYFKSGFGRKYIKGKIKQKALSSIG
ncbi:MAG: GIY-YIG nuclease family protein [Parcubacteria group bacterium]